MALSFLGCKLATALDWKSEAKFHKLSLAAMLHDLALPGDDDLVLRHDGCGSATQGWTTDELAIVHAHPKTVAGLVNGLSDVPGEVAFLLEQHHENAEGSGYPRGLSQKDLSPISALFIITHDLVSEVYRVPEGTFVLEKYLAQCEREKRFTKGSFGVVFRGIMGKLKELS